MKVRRSRRLGFTLVEAMVALFLLSGASIMFYGLMPMTAKSGKMVGNHQQAVSLVQHKIDQLRAVGYGRLTFSELKVAGVIDEAPTTAPFSFKNVDELLNFYGNPTGTIEVADFSANVRRVTVTLTWTGSAFKQGNGTVSLQALISRG